METLTRREALKVVGCAAGFAALGPTLAGCSAPSGENATGEGNAAESAKAPHGDAVVVTMTPGSEPPAGFDPFVSWGCGEHVHEPLIQSTLIATNTDLTFKNDLATSYSCSDDGLLWTFAIRDGVKFTNGDPLTAADVAYTLEGIRTNAASEADLSMVESVEAPDDTTVLIHLNKPFNALLYTLAVVGIVPKDAHGEDYGQHPIGSGRYMLEQWDRGQQVILVANPDYYGEPPKMKRVVVLFMDEDASLAAASSGMADIAYTSAPMASRVPEGYDLLNCQSVDSRGISLPTQPAGYTMVIDGDEAYMAGNDVTCSQAVRQAINYGLDRQRLVEEVLDGYGSVAFSVSDGMPWASEAMKCATDVDFAARLLDEDGWTMASDGVRAKEGVRASMALWYMAGDSVRQALAEAVKLQLAPLGLEVVVRGASFNDIVPHQYADPVLWGWGSNAPTELYNLNFSSGWGNFADYESPVVDGYLNAALATPTVEESFGLWQAAQWDGSQGVAPQGAATWAWLVNVDHLYFARIGLQVAEQKPHPHGHGWSLVNNVDQWWWDDASA